MSVTYLVFVQVVLDVERNNIVITSARGSAWRLGSLELGLELFGEGCLLHVVLLATIDSVALLRMHNIDVVYDFHHLVPNPKIFKLFKTE